MRMSILTFLLLAVLQTSANAGEADVVNVEATKTGDNIYNFNVTVVHVDEGWNHYANKWDVLDGDGTVLGTRILHHPHVDEQPFTRSLSGVKTVDGITHITVRAHDLMHEYGGKVVTIALL